MKNGFYATREIPAADQNRASRRHPIKMKYYLTWEFSLANQIRVLCRQPIRLEYYVTRELSTVDQLRVVRRQPSRMEFYVTWELSATKSNSSVTSSANLNGVLRHPIALSQGGGLFSALAWVRSL